MVKVEPIAFVRGGRASPDDDFWGGALCAIELVDAMPPDALDGIEEFSHLEVVYIFHRVEPAAVVTAARRPRGRSDWPRVGIFAQRGKDRPNRIGCSIVRLVRRETRAIIVAELDAIDGTPVLDLKPVFAEFLPREPVGQPAWSHDIMRDYWTAAGEAP